MLNLNWLLVGCGGFLGSILRYFCTMLGNRWQTGGFPLGTFAVNLLGSFAIGFFAVLFAHKMGLAKQWQLLLQTGFLGGFTTFSTFSLESVQLWQRGAYLLSVSNVLLHLVLCFCGVLLGQLLAKQIAS